MKKNSKTLLTESDKAGIIFLALITGAKMERYRSGHNEAVLKTVCPQGRVGSNPTLSVYNVYRRCRLKNCVDKINIAY